MAAPAKIIIDHLISVGDFLRDLGRFEEALDVDIIVEAVNAAGHQNPWDWYACTHAAESLLQCAELSLRTDAAKMVRAALVPLADS